MTHRIIYSLQFELEPRPTDTPGASRVLLVNLKRDGNSDSSRNGRPRNKARTIDLRVGDEMMVGGLWSKIIGITPYRQNWMTDEQAAADKGEDGYLYLLKGETRTPEEMRLAHPG